MDFLVSIICLAGAICPMKHIEFPLKATSQADCVKSVMAVGIRNGLKPADYKVTCELRGK